MPHQERERQARDNNGVVLLPREWIIQKKVINLNAAPGVIVRHYLGRMHRGCYKVPWL